MGRHVPPAKRARSVFVELVKIPEDDVDVVGSADPALGDASVRKGVRELGKGPSWRNPRAFTFPAIRANIGQVSVARRGGPGQVFPPNCPMTEDATGGREEGVTLGLTSVAQN